MRKEVENLKREKIAMQNEMQRLRDELIIKEELAFTPT
jgi:hypothetical protein